MYVGLLEDDTAIQEMLLLVLQDEGYGVTAYQSAKECIDALTEAAQDPSVSVPVDLMIVDWRLSGPLSGIEVIQQLRAQSRLSSLPIILTTAATFSDSSLLQDLRVTLLEKPFSVDDMTALVKQLIQ
ncbi:MAG TPA: response regulator, partial [Ktedonobacteraceae bacterium]|nr:response regulator [Ktedonobacteraceae bacterium]